MYFSERDKMVFYIDDCARENAPFFEDVKIKGYYCLDSERSMKFDCSQLRYYTKRENGTVYLDLNEGIENARHFTDLLKNIRLDNVLQWISKNHRKIAASPKGEKWLEPKFISRRGAIERLLETPYKTKENWIMCAAKWKGSIYLCYFDTDETILRKKNKTTFHKNASCWGHKFEQYILSDTAGGLPNIDRPVDQNTQFCGIFLSRVGDHSLLYSAEMDGVCSNETLKDPLPLDELKFIELKTSRDIANVHRRRTFCTHTSLSWWSQCAPVGVENVLCGFRDDEGIVKELKTYSQNSMKNEIRMVWNPARSMHFLNDFLTHVSKVVMDDYDKTIYKFEKSSYDDFILVNEVSPSSEYSFLPEWYRCHET